MRLSEAHVGKLVKSILSLHGWLVLKTDAGAAKKATRGASPRGGDFLPGWPDLTALHPNRPPVLIEVKRPGGRIRPSQRLTLEALRQMGFRAYLVDGLETLAQMLREVEPLALKSLEVIDP